MTQKEALDILKTGRNVFLTGAAGSGKTYVLKEYIKYLSDINADIAVTASTGIAATHMGGVTIHSWSGIGIKDEMRKDDILEITEKSNVRNRIQNTKVLIIDEISMLHHFRLDFVDTILKEIKKNEEPFGGMQVVLCGDFFQLPPIKKSYEREAFFAYRSVAWKNLNLKVCYLSEQHRQNDLDYLAILNAIRNAEINEKILNILENRIGKKPEFEPTKLYSHNKNVDLENEINLEKIKNQTFEYSMRERGKKSILESLKKSCLAPETLKLKKGAKVMFIKNNFDLGFANGTIGTVIDCSFENIKVKTISGLVVNVERESWRIEEDGKTKAEINQYPLRLAWAITIHKSQGMSLDQAEIDLGSSFERGMGYVALSRVRSLEGLFLKGINEMALKVDEEVLKLDSHFKNLSKTNSFHIRTMGEEKLDKFHNDFIEKIRGERKKEKISKGIKISTTEETKSMLKRGLNIKEIAKARGLKLGTILDHIEQIRSEDPKYNIYNLRNNIPKNKFQTIYQAFKKKGLNEEGKYLIAPVKEILGSKYSYEDLRLVRLFL